MIWHSHRYRYARICARRNHRDVADEFDIEDPDIVPDGPDAYIVLGSAAVVDVERKLGLSFGEVDVDSISGLMMHFAERLVSAGDVWTWRSQRQKYLKSPMTVQPAFESY